MSERPAGCGVILACGRPALHRGHHGGFRRVPAGDSSQLTAGELAVITAIASGLTWDQVTHELRISRQTLHRRRSEAMRKYDVGSFPELLTAIGWLVVPRSVSVPFTIR